MLWRDVLGCCQDLSYGWMQHSLLRLRRQVCNLDDNLSKVLALEHAHERVWGALDALCDRQLGLETTVGQPLLHLLLVLLGIGEAEMGVGDDEALDGDAPGDNEGQVAD